MMIAGSAMLAVSIGLNTILRHFDHFSNICTVQLVALTAFVTCALASYRELRHIAILGWLGTASIFISVAVLVAAVLFSPNPPLAPPDESWEKHIELFGSASFTESALSVLDIVVAFSGTVSTSLLDVDYACLPQSPAHVLFCDFVC